jgi:hypothetical protein
VENQPNGNIVGVRNHKIMEKKRREKKSDQKVRARGSSFSVGY